MNSKSLLAITLALLAFPACASSNPQRVESIRAALGKSEVSLADSISRAEGRDDHPVATRAMLAIQLEPHFSVLANAGAAKQEIRLDRTGKILSVAQVGTAGTTCPGATTAKDAVGIAEKASGGKAFQVQADDDDPCLYEVQTLNGSTIWEVKIDRNGSVLEKEDATDDTAD